MAAGLNFDVLAQRAAGIPVPYSYALGPTPGTPATGAAGIGTVAPVAGGGSLAGTYSPYYGGIPQAPSMQQAQSGAMAANLANFPAAQQMASQADAARWASYTSRFPNYGPLTQQESQNFNYMLGGGNLNVPASVQAAKNLYGGYSGSGFGSNLTNRAIDEYAMKNMALGTNLLTQAMGRGQAVPTTDINAYSVSPAQNYSAMLQQAIYGAAPIPSYAAYAAQQAALQGLMLGRQSGTGATAPAAATTQAGPSIAQQVADILSRYSGQGQQGLPQQTTVQTASTTPAYSPTIYGDTSYQDVTMLGTGGPYGNGMLYPELYDYSYDPNLGTGVYTPKPDEGFMPGYNDTWPSDFFPEMTADYYGY